MTTEIDDEDDAPRPAKVKKPPPPAEPGSDIYTGWIESEFSMRVPLEGLGVELSNEQVLGGTKRRWHARLSESTLDKIKFLWGAVRWDLSNTGYYKKER